MNIQNEDLELIEAYLNGRLEGDEKTNVEDRLTSDPSFKELLEFVQSAKNAIRENALSEKKEFLKNIESQVSKSGGSKNIFKLNLRILSIAASIVLIVSIAIVFATDRVDKALIDAEFVHVDSELNLVRSNDADRQDVDRLKAYSLYEVKSYKEAAPLLEKYYVENRDTASLYFSCISYLASYKLQKAKACLEHPALVNSNFEKTKYLELIERASR